MKHHVNFTPGPSQLYFTVPDHAREAFRNGIPSLSHRSATFEKIYAEAIEGLRALLDIPSSHYIFFASSATEIWERSIENLVDESSVHFVNGAFSSRFFEIARQLDKASVKMDAQPGQSFSEIPAFDGSAELIALTHNETSTGAMLPLDVVHQAREKNPNALIVVDAVSSLPFPAFDFAKIDSVFFSVQKGFGLPAGLGVWIVNEACIEKASHRSTRGKSIGSYHSLLSLHALGARNQTPETPNVLGIYLLSRVVQDFLRRGVEAIRRETVYKSALLYQTLQDHPLLSAFVSRPEWQSKTVIVAETGTQTENLARFLAARGLLAGDGYGAQKQTQLRFANFPAHSKEQFELLADALTAFEG